MNHCDFTDLPSEMCSHCRGLDEPPAKQQAEYWTTAGFPSRCPSCDDRIRTDDRIGLVDGEWLCQRCAS